MAMDQICSKYIHTTQVRTYLNGPHNSMQKPITQCNSKRSLVLQRSLYTTIYLGIITQVPSTFCGENAQEFERYYRSVYYFKTDLDEAICFSDLIPIKILQTFLMIFSKIPMTTSIKTYLCICHQNSCWNIHVASEFLINSDKNSDRNLQYLRLQYNAMHLDLL